MRFLRRIRLSRGNYPNDLIIFPIAMTYDEQSRFFGHAEHDESVFIFRMIVNEQSIRIIKHAFRFAERYLIFRYHPTRSES